ncbi:hypothetical protein CLV84_1008 [Neolewinella xylanilytica]|uniref:DUF1680 family protein n=1 Tax=Neolewinella xylanilytica TaxID=1514080 RepID=A0A2S6I977_9BACT|nr:glycoside hydrolase family 127 protein [Neolewinella xylanilytica]PPK88045.1 hypothetical protein CLV84_1008 [Neolewinella xylanilytica]
MKSILPILLALILGCQTSAPETEARSTTVPDTGYPITPVDIRNVKVTDDFWLPIIERVQEKTIEYAIAKCEEEGRLENFLIAGGEMEGEVRGEMPFDDTDVYKVIEGASNSLISAPNPQLESLLDSLIAIVATGQEADGYLTTWRTIDPDSPPAPWVPVEDGQRWDGLSHSHELYNAGHLYEAAYTHHLATGKDNFLNIALANADLMVRTFGEGDDKIHTVPGHQIIETGLIKLYRLTGREDYLNLARYFLDHRGDPETHELFGSYSQDHLPVTQQDEVVGHAVRAVYMYAAMTDIAAIQQDADYRLAVDKLWKNMVEKKTYVTGGIGALHEGEAFGENYELPNLTAYNETCAAIGSVYWNQRLHALTGDVKYLDVLERTLYNGLIAGLALDGTHFFYPNPLESDGKYEFNQGACTRKDWFDCSCCPTNLIRFLPAVPGLIYAKSGDTIYVNLYAGSEADIDLGSQQVTLRQETRYPWTGQVDLTVTPETAGPFSLKLRIPGWARNEVLPGGLYDYANELPGEPTVTLNGELLTEAPIVNGYVTLSREWKAGDRVELDFPLEVRQVVASQEVAENRGKVSLEYGPIVYAVESIDNEARYDGIEVAPGDTYSVAFRPELLGGVNVVENDGLMAIPYYAWSNRGVNKMRVWLPASVSR